MPDLDQQPDPVPAPTETQVDWPVMMATYLGAALVFYPLAQWLFRTTEANDQLFHALIVLAAAGVFLLFEKRRRLHLVLAHDRQSVALLALSFLLATASMFLPAQDDTAGAFAHNALLLTGFGLALASLVRFTLGPVAAKAARGFIVAFTVFMLLALALPLVDWPMRALAGRGSLEFLRFIGQGAQLELVQTPQPALILAVEGRPFHVAAECNGFGLLTSSILLTVLLAIYRRLKALDFCLVLGLALFTAFIGNTLRILVIVLLAPHIDNYMLMHEIVGLIFFYGALAFLWWFVWGYGPNREAPKAAC
ncbi:MAG: exosortase/archaeosortase family protein [Puniceicoccales bacterium]